MKRFVSLVGCCFALALTNTTQAQTECGAAVEVGATSITVSPDAGSDTENLQCALDQAVANGIPTVELAEGEFSIQSVSVTGFDGSVNGKS
jgi:hypothetical protein